MRYEPDEEKNTFYFLCNCFPPSIREYIPTTYEGNIPGTELKYCISPIIQETDDEQKFFCNVGKPSLFKEIIGILIPASVCLYCLIIFILSIVSYVGKLRRAKTKNQFDSESIDQTENNEEMKQLINN